MANKISNYTTDNKVEVVKLDKPQKSFDYKNGKVILSVRHLKQFFQFGRGKFKYTKAVHDVSFDVYKGEVFGLVGESGCGKTTTGRSIIKLYKITSGNVWFDGHRIAAGTRWNEKEIKFTRIRLNEFLKKDKHDEQEEIANLLIEDQSNINKGRVEGETDDAYIKKQIEEIKAKHKALRDEEIAKAQEIIKREIANIKSARHDDRCCNRDIAKEAVKNVKDEYIPKIKEDIVNFKEKGIKDVNAALKLKDTYLTYRKALHEAKNESITRKMQMIFQDPIASLNPRMTVRNIIAEGLIIRGVRDKELINKEVNRVLELVGLLPEHANRYPHEFSGGQRQRIGIARAIIMNPELIIADEPVSALDVSIQAQVINLLNDLRNDLGLTILFIAHNLSVVKYFCDRIAVMYYGELMEVATSEELFKHPLHPYTKSLLSAVPHPDPNIEQGRTRIRYNPATDHDYSKQGPKLREIVPGHFIRCNDEEEKKYLEELANGAK